MTPKAASSAGGPRCTLAALAARLGGEPDGDPRRELTGAAGLPDAGPDDLSFVDGPRAVAAAAASLAGVLLAPPGLALAGRDLIRVRNPRLAFAAALAFFHPPRRPAPGVHPSAVVEADAVVDPTASVGALCFVGAGAVVGPRCELRPLAYVGPGAALGEDSLLHPGAIVLDGVRVGPRAIVHSGAVLGSDGFGYVFDGGAHHKIPQVGTVEVGEDVEIGACTAVDRATTGVTRIGAGAKVDNLVQVGHNVSVGERAILVAQVGLGGSTTVGAGAVLAGQAGVGDHAVIGPGATVGGQAGVIRHVAAGATVAGFGPQPHGEFLRCQAVFEQLPQLRRRVLELEKRLAAAEAAAGMARDAQGGRT